MAAASRRALAGGPRRTAAANSARRLFQAGPGSTPRARTPFRRPAESVGPIPDPDLLTLLLAVEEDVVLPAGEQITAGSLPESWAKGGHAADASLLAALPGLSLWDPVDGWTEDPPRAVGSGRWPSCCSPCLPVETTTGPPSPIWTSGRPPRPKRKRDRPQALLLGVLHQLRMVQAAQVESTWLVRLTALGRAVADGAKSLPPDRTTVEQTLLVQPNLEIILFRQGLTPALIARLSRFAVWKTLGLACTLQLTAESVYHGLEGGETLADLLALFERHGTRGLSETVLGSLRSWASKRERGAGLSVGDASGVPHAGRSRPGRRPGTGRAQGQRPHRPDCFEDRINYGQFRFVGTRDYLAPEEFARPLKMTA